MVRSSTQPSFGSETSAADSSADRAVRVSVLVVTADDGLWNRLTSGVPGLDAHQFDSTTEVLEHWNATRPAVVLLDARGEAALPALVEKILTHGGALVPVALVDEEHRAVAATLERKRALFDHLRVPLDIGTVRTVIDRAAEEALARLLLTSGDAGVGAGAPRRKSGPALPLIGWIAGGLGLLAVGAAVFFLNGPSTPDKATPTAVATKVQPAAAREPAAAPSTATTGLSPDEVEAMLDGARVAMREKRYIDPASDNALGRYKSVLDVDPTNGEARQGLDRIAELLISRAAAAIASRDYSTALRAVEVARSLKPDHPRLAALDGQLGDRMHDLSLTQIQAALQANSFARATTLIQQAERLGNIPAAQLDALKADMTKREAAAEVANFAHLAQARIAQGKLLDPAEDSAKHYLQLLSARGGAGQADELGRLSDAFNRRVTLEARAAMTRGAYADADAWIAELKANGVPATQLVALQREVERSQQAARGPDAQRLAQLVRDRLQSHRLTSPDSDSALHYFRALATADAQNAALPALKDSLVAGLLEQAKSSSGSGNTADSQAAADAARELGVPFAQIAAAQANGTAAAQPAMATPPKLLKTLAPLYPDRAATAGIEGWADVEFLVNVKGTTENVHVVASEPKTVFDQAAVLAVKKARFEPAKATDGSALAITTKLRVRFALQGSK